MARPITYTTYPISEIYSEIIDVRSEGEFAEDCLPGAINLPVLNNEQRVKVGTIYKQVSPFEARKIGAALTAENIAIHLQQHFADKDKDYCALVYCWRGGQRSRSLALVLSEIGWEVNLLEGGYKTYRSYVREQLEQLPQKFTYKIVCGLTGTGKTQILQRMKQKGLQVLDLEALANHRGSLLGQQWELETTILPSKQPSQKSFESLLLQHLQGFHTNEVVWLESESNKIGEVYIPTALWQMMQQAKCVEVQLSQQARIEWLLQEYPHLQDNPEVLKSKLKMLKNRHGRQKIEQWFGLIEQGNWYALVGDLLSFHYDPAYSRSLKKSYYSRCENSIALVDLSAASIDEAIAKLLL